MSMYTCFVSYILQSRDFVLEYYGFKGLGCPGSGFRHLGFELLLAASRLRATV